MIKIFDYVDACSDGDHDLVGFDELSLIWIHRIGPGIGSNAVEISRAFQDETKGAAGSYTGGNMAYTLINTREQVQQALALNERGAHARKWGNMWGTGFAQIGDFNKQAPTNDQWERAVDTCALIVPWLAPHSDKMLSLLPDHLHAQSIVGHGEVPSAYGAGSGKQQPSGKHACPGNLWDMDEFRQDVQRVIKDQHGPAMIDAGIRFT